MALSLSVVVESSFVSFPGAVGSSSSASVAAMRLLRRSVVPASSNSQLHLISLNRFESSSRLTCRAVCSWDLVFESADGLTGALLVLVVLDDGRWVGLVVGLDRSLEDFLDWHDDDGRYVNANRCVIWGP